MNVVELLTEVFIACRVIHTQACDKRNIGNSQVNTAVLYLCRLKTLHIDLRIRIEQTKDVARRLVYLNGMDVAALTHVGGHEAKDIADTSTTFKHPATFEAHCTGYVPKGINHIGRGVVGTITAHIGLLVGFFTKQLPQLPINPIKPIRTKRLAKTTPTAELT